MSKSQRSIVIALQAATAFSLILAGCATSASSATAPAPILATASPTAAAPTLATASATAPAAIPTATSTAPPTLSEQPDKATFAKYFSEMWIGRLPPGATSPADLERNVTVFAAGDNIYLSCSTLVPQVPMLAKYYNVATQQSVTSNVGIPAQPKTGNFGSWAKLELSTGKYELKIYVDNVLVAVFPFEVR
jgi:hypothetical protein